MTDITLLDGSVGQELVIRSGDTPTPLWSTQVMRDHPELVAQVHRDYVAAGATVLSTNTYPVHRSRLAPVGLEGQFFDLLDIAMAQVQAAKDPGVRVAGCLGPVLATYRPDLEPDEAMAAARFGEIASHIAPHVDLFLIETVSSLQEARGALAGALGHNVPVWIAFSVDDRQGTLLRSGEPVADAIQVLDGVDAVLINCSRPEVIGAAMPILASAGLPFGAYANGFDGIADGFLAADPTVDALAARTDLGPRSYADFAMSWIDQGATIVGGCCEIGPAHIAEIARRLRAAGHRIV